MKNKTDTLEAEDKATSEQSLKAKKRKKRPHLYYTEKNISQILSNLDTLRADVYPESIQKNENEELQKYFPSVCLIGLGRCGTNIALDVATLVYNARNFYLKQYDSEEKQKKNSGNLGIEWIQKQFSLSRKQKNNSLFLIEPIVMLGDLDKDIEGRIRYSTLRENDNFLLDYRKMAIMNLAEVHAGGAGNAPILGQYLAKIILNKKTDKFSDEKWKFIHSYLIDSCGIKANQSRLYFYIFSAGGGTGSGMASEFGLAQQYAYMSKIFDLSNIHEQDDQRQSFVFEPIFTTGICILPNLKQASVVSSEALHINAGRLLCKYLSEEWDFSYNHEDGQNELDDGVMKKIRPWNSMMLISNDIMAYAEESDAKLTKDIDVNTMEKYANQYISQQIFNILTAQAVTTDYDKNYFHMAKIDIAETIRLDANDLFMSLAGPVAVAYAESEISNNSFNPSVASEKSNSISIDDLFFRSISLPHFNAGTKAIEGISLLPIEASLYKEYLSRYKESNFNAKEIRHLHFFKNCSSIVNIISLPKGYKLSYQDLNRLKEHLNGLFPNTTLKRFALVIGASAHLSLTTLIAKSPCLSDDFLTLITAYIKRCFSCDNLSFDGKIEKEILEMITGDSFDETKLDEMLSKYENPAKILDTNWFAIKPMYERKYRELIQSNEKFISINDIRLSLGNVKKAIKYLREIYRHKISPLKVMSLNKSEGVERASKNTSRGE